MMKGGHSMAVDDEPEQKFVDEHFNAESTFWRDVYRRKDVLGSIYRLRQVVALGYVNELGLAKTARVLEIGCGAGLVAVAVARKGFTVEAVDHAHAMIELTQRHARQAGLASRIHTAIEDVHELTFEDCSFDLIVALGVVAWLHDLRRGLAEIARVLTPGGYVVLSVNNRYQMPVLLDVASVLRWRVQGLERTGLHDSQRVARLHSYSIKEFNLRLREVNLTRTRITSIGFGPFKMLGHNIFSDRTGVKIHQRLQRYADGNFPILRSTGVEYIVLARKRALSL
jgi:2-polyprenyl-3-methyl-5-hydroxy-6-metoxy-1,4-benzoquinol methylase